MEWISGIGRDSDGRLCVQAQGVDGARHLVGLDRVDASLRLKQSPARKASFSFQDLRRGDTRAYLDGIGMPLWDETAQSVYEVECGFGTLVIPAQLLVLATLGHQVALRRTLLTPWGPNCLMTTLAHEKETATRRVQHGTGFVSFEHIELRLRWIHMHRSAAAAWGSVYRNALQGRFEMVMPQAAVESSVFVRRVGRKYLATRLQLMKVCPTENCHVFAAGHAARDYVFDNSIHQRPTHLPVPPASSDSRLRNDDGLKPLTDNEWLTIVPLLAAQPTVLPGADGRYVRRHQLRDLVDIIRLKLGTPYSWSKVPAEKLQANAASVMFSKLQRAGVWDQVVVALSSSPCSG